QQWPVAHEAARQRELLPLTEADFDAAGPRRAELCRQPLDQPLDDVGRAGAIDRDRYGRHVVEPRHVANADGMARLEFEAEEILERAGHSLAPLVRRHPREIDAVDQDAAPARLTPAAQRL